MLKSVGIMPVVAVLPTDGMNIMRITHMRQAHIKVYGCNWGGF